MSMMICFSHNIFYFTCYDDLHTNHFALMGHDDLTHYDHEYDQYQYYDDS